MGSILSAVAGWWNGNAQSRWAWTNVLTGVQVAAVTFAEDGDLGPDADTPNPTTGLTPRHCTAMTRTWDIVKPDIKIHGVNFFLYMFRKEPVLQTRFKGFSGKTQEQLRTSKRLVAHGSTVLGAISNYVDNLNDVEVLVELLKNTGENHKERGVPKNDFALLAPLLVQFLKENLGSAWTPIAEEAWTQAMKAITSVILSAYD